MQIVSWDSNTGAKNAGQSEKIEEALEAIFTTPVRRDIIHRVLIWQLAKARSGNHQTKEIWAVRGSTRKIVRQKGSGGARHGSKRAPQFRGGAVIFGPVRRSHEFKLNKKVRHLGLMSALSLKAKEGGVIILDKATLETTKTKLLLQKLSNIMVTPKQKTLIVDTNVQHELRLSATNLFNINTLPTVGLNVRDILRHEKLVITLDAVKALCDKLSLCSHG